MKLRKRREQQELSVRYDFLEDISNTDGIETSPWSRATFSSSYLACLLITTRNGEFIDFYAGMGDGPYGGGPCLLWSVAT